MSLRFISTEYATIGLDLKLKVLRIGIDITRHVDYPFFNLSLVNATNGGSCIVPRNLGVIQGNTLFTIPWRMVSISQAAGTSRCVFRDFTIRYIPSFKVNPQD